MSNKIISLISLVLVIAFVGSAGAAVYWDNDSADQQWDTTSNWSGDAGPTTLPAIEFGTRGGPNECIIDAGTTANEPTKLWVPMNAGSNGSLLISGGDLTATEHIYSGYRGTGIIKMTSGSMATTTYDIDIGTNSGATGTIDIEAGTVVADRYFYVGNAGTGTLNISGGSISVTDYDLIIGDDSGSSGTVNISGGTINITRYLQVGDVGTGTINMTAGSIRANNNLQVPNTDTGSGTVNLDGGTISASNISMRTGAVESLLNIEGGTLLLDGDDTATISSYISSGLITAYGGDGTISYDYNVTNAGKTTVTATCLKAYSPSPADTATNVAVDANLSWSAGAGATSHDVYFGTSSPGSFQGNQAGTTYNPSGNMDANTTYYWRIDEVAGANTTTGNVWSFTTSPPPPQAAGPSPADSSTGIGRQVDISWDSEPLASSYDVYFGTSSPGASQGNQAGTTFDTGTMDANTTYYWRIDTKNESGTTTGNVWSFTTIAGGLTVQNSSYSVVQDTNFVLTVTNKDCNTSLQFTPEFTVFYSSTQPALATASQLTAEWSGDENLYGCGPNTVLEPYKAEIVDGNLVWTFPDQTNFGLTATVDMSTDFNEPALFWTLQAKSTGWYMAGYTGAATCNPTTMEKIVQPAMAGYMPDGPMDASSPTFPSEPTFAQEFLATLPTVITRDANNINCAVVVNPDVQTYRFPHYKDIEFGMSIRNRDGLAQPAVFAPEMGINAGDYMLTSKDSYMEPNETHSFSVIWMVDNGKWEDLYKRIATVFYEVKDFRDNSGPGSLNNLLANLIDYALDADGNNYNMWDPEQKCNEYWTDQPYSFKILGGLFAINAAIVMDNNELFWDRALPQVEYGLSREAMGFHPYDVNYNDQMTINTDMTGPWMKGLDIGNLWLMTGRRTTPFKIYSLEKGHTDHGHLFQQSQEWYRIYGDVNEMDYAIYGAYYTINDNYHPADFQKFLEIYEDTGDPNFLDEAIRNAYEFTTSLHISPRVPDSNVTVDVNDEAPIHWQTAGRHVAWGFDPPLPMYAPEQSVPAWRPSVVGMQPESYTAFTPSEFPGALLRVAYYADDDFLKAMARNAFVGRWANYPGQQTSVDFSLVWDQDNFCMHPLEYMTFTSMHFWHHWQHFIYVFDFLVSDAVTKSAENIWFDKGVLFDYGAGGRQDIYGGHNKGTFYGDDDITLWIPRDLLTITGDGEQINYIAGYGNGNLYLALCNQSSSALSNVQIALNSSLVNYGSSHTANIWEDSVAQADGTVSSGSITVDVPASGITALIIQDIDVVKGPLHTSLEKPAYTLHEDSLSRTTESFGDMTGMIISFGPDATEAYCYTSAQPYWMGGVNDTNYVTMYYSTNGGSSWQNTTDEIYPFEFSIKFDPALVDDFRFYFDVFDDEDANETSDVITLNMSVYEASRPSPAYQATEVSTSANLSWKVGCDANSYDVYFGTSYSAVADANLASSEYKGSQEANSYDPGTLANNTTYYWRIDTVNEPNEWKGNVWSFTTEDSTPLFTDSFENGQWDSKWTEDAQNDWFDDTERSTDGTKSATVDGVAADATLTSIAIDVSGCNTVTINFDWYIETGWDNGEYIKFETKKDSGSWVEQDSLDGNVDEGSWVEYNNTTFDVTGVSNLYLQFKANVDGSNEDGQVDNVTVTAN